MQLTLASGKIQAIAFIRGDGRNVICSAGAGRTGPNVH